MFKTISTAYVGPLQFAVAEHKIYVTDSFTASLFEVGQSAPLAHNGGRPDAHGDTADLAGVAVDPRTGVIAFAESSATHRYTRLLLRSPNGQIRVLADLSAYEALNNPDGDIHYGVDHPSACVKRAFAKIGAPVSYSGVVDSHPYAVLSLGGGSWAVADAGANDVLRVDASGHISLIAVLPPDPVKITAALAASNGLPACTVGITYKFESVPTDVIMGPFGSLLVSTLTGAPTASGSVWAIGFHGRLTRIAGGFAEATNVAYDPRSGTIYVAELAVGRIAAVHDGVTTVVARLPDVVGLAFADGHLYASTAPAANGDKGPGAIVEFS